MHFDYYAAVINHGPKQLIEWLISSP